MYKRVLLRVLRPLFNLALRGHSNPHRSNNRPSSERLLTVLKDARDIVQMDPDHFQIRGLIKDDQLLDNILSKFETAQEVAKIGHPIAWIARDAFNIEVQGGVMSSRPREHGLIDDRDANLLVLFLLAKLTAALPIRGPPAPTAKVVSDGEYVAKSTPLTEEEKVFERQLAYIESYKLLDVAMLIHQRGILEIEKDLEKGKERAIHNGNKLSVLAGDYLVAYALVKVAKRVRDQRVLDMIGSAIDEFCEYGCTFPDPWTVPLAKMDLLDWEHISGHGASRLFAYSCQFIPMIGQSPERQQRAAFVYGLQMINLKSLLEDVLAITIGPSDRHEPLKLVSAPLLAHAEHDPQFFSRLRALSATGSIDIHQVKSEVLNGPALSKCQQIGRVYASGAIKSLELFPNHKARDALSEIVSSLEQELNIVTSSITAP